MLKTSTKVLTVLLFVLIPPMLTHAHSGRTDKFGGHYDRKTGDYHLHSAGTIVKVPSKTEQQVGLIITQLYEIQKIVKQNANVIKQVLTTLKNLCRVVMTVQSDVTKLKANVKELKGDIKELKEEIKRLQGEMSRIKSNQP